MSVVTRRSPHSPETTDPEAPKKAPAVSNSPPTSTLYPVLYGLALGLLIALGIAIAAFVLGLVSVNRGLPIVTTAGSCTECTCNWSAEGQILNCTNGTNSGPVDTVAGTANQVTSSCTLGTCTLSTPDPFIPPGEVILGGNSTRGPLITIYGTLPGTSANSNLLVKTLINQQTTTPGATGAQNMFSSNIAAYVANTDNVTYTAAVFGQQIAVTYGGQGGITGTLVGQQILNQVNGSSFGTIESSVALLAGGMQSQATTSSAGTVNNVIGVQILGPNSTNIVVENNYGLVIEHQNMGQTLNYMIWLATIGTSSGSGIVWAGATTPASPVCNLYYGGHGPQTDFPFTALAYAGTQTANFTLGAASVVGSGASATCTTGHVCDSVSGTITLTAGSSISATGPFLTIDLMVSRTNDPNCDIDIYTTGSGLFSSYYPTTGQTTVTLTSTSNLSSTTYTIWYLCGGI
jgi:hypothetical protein